MPKTELRSVVRNSVLNRLSTYLALKAQEKALQADIAKLKDKINADLLDAPDNTIEDDEFRATLVKSTNSRIDSEKLLELGVKPSIIRRATVETPYAYPKVVSKKKSDQ